MVGEEGAEKSGRRRIAGGANKVIWVKISKDGADAFHLNLKHKLNLTTLNCVRVLKPFLSLALGALCVVFGQFGTERRKREGGLSQSEGFQFSLFYSFFFLIFVVIQLN